MPPTVNWWYTTEIHAISKKPKSAGQVFESGLDRPATAKVLFGYDSQQTTAGRLQETDWSEIALASSLKNL
jgi:hypothetical protein